MTAGRLERGSLSPHPTAYASIRQHTSAYVSICQRLSSMTAGRLERGSLSPDILQILSSLV